MSTHAVPVHRCSSSDHSLSGGLGLPRDNIRQARRESRDATREGRRERRSERRADGGGLPGLLKTAANVVGDIFGAGGSAGQDGSIPGGPDADAIAQMQQAAAEAEARRRKNMMVVGGVGVGVLVLGAAFLVPAGPSKQ